MNNSESEVQSGKKPTRIVLCQFLNILRSLNRESSGVNLEKIFRTDQEKAGLHVYPLIFCAIRFWRRAPGGKGGGGLPYETDGDARRLA